MMGYLLFAIGGVLLIGWGAFLLYGFTMLGGDVLFLDDLLWLLILYVLFVVFYVISLSIYINSKKRKKAELEKTADEPPE